MDKFDETIKKLKSAGPEEKKMKVEMFGDKCRCPVCPIRSARKTITRAFSACRATASAASAR
jgi:hypothetical protein